MDVFEAIKKRRSVRKFTNKNVPEDIIQQLLEAAIWAPSGGNLQTWHFIVVRNSKIKAGLTDATRGQGCIYGAPVVIVVCCNYLKSTKYGERGAELFTLHDTGAAIQNILLTATSLGLGTVWVGAFDELKAAEVLGLNHSEIRPVALIPVGYPGEFPKGPGRKPLREVVDYM